MAAKQTVFGPYRVINGKGVYEVVEMVSPTSLDYKELRPQKTYLHRQSAFGLCARLNRRWQRERAASSDYDLLEDWKNATN